MLISASNSLWLSDPHVLQSIPPRTLDELATVTARLEAISERDTNCEASVRTKYVDFGDGVLFVAIFLARVKPRHSPAT
jgi:hypothetical protein